MKKIIILLSVLCSISIYGREKAVGYINGDALLAFCLKPINQQCEVNILPHRAVFAAILRDGGERIIHNEAAIIQQAPDQRRLAVIHRTAGQEAQEGVGDFNPCLHQK